MNKSQKVTIYAHAASLALCAVSATLFLLSGFTENPLMFIGALLMAFTTVVAARNLVLQIEIVVRHTRHEEIERNIRNLKEIQRLLR